MKEANKVKDMKRNERYEIRIRPLMHNKELRDDEKHLDFMLP